MCNSFNRSEVVSGCFPLMLVVGISFTRAFVGRQGEGDDELRDGLVKILAGTFHKGRMA